MTGDHQNTLVNIAILIVDNDPIASSAISNIIKNMKYKDKSFGEIKIITARDWSEAIITLSIELNKINLIIIDYHILGLNIIKLKQTIYEEFGNLPIIVMSSKMSNEIEEEIECIGGNLGFIKKPIEEEETLKIIKKYAFNCNDNMKSHWSYTENEKTILYPDKTVLDPLYDVRMESRTRSEKKTTENVCRRSRKRRSKEINKTLTKPKIRWSHDRRHKFLQAVRHLGIHKAVPKKILKFMDDKSLTRENVASHLQKYRNFLKRIRENSQLMSLIESKRSINANFASSSHQFSNFNQNLTNEPFGSQFGYDFNQPFNYFNHIPNQIGPNQTGSNQTGPNYLLSGLNDNFGYSNYGTISSNEERRSPSQTFNDYRFEQYDITNGVSGMNFNGSFGNGYGNGGLVDFGGSRYNSNSNIGFFGESSNPMNLTFNDNNMNNIHGNSNFEFPLYNNIQPQVQQHPQNNIIASPSGMVSLLQSLDFSPNITNFQIDHNEHHQNEANGENLQEVPYDDFLESNSIFSLPRIEDLPTFNNENSNEQTSNLMADDFEIYCPISDINFEHGGLGVDELFNQELNEEEFVESLFNKKNLWSP